VALDSALATRQNPHALEAHAYFRVLAKANEARLHGAVAAAPAAGCLRRFEEVRSNRCQRHAAKSPTLTQLSG
jgi:hypothetical protein